MTEQFSVADRTVLVTGAGGGIGSAIANAFAKAALTSWRPTPTWRTSERF